MGWLDLQALLPILTLSLLIVVLMVWVGFARRRAGLVLGAGLVGLVAALAAIGPAFAVIPRQVTPLLIVDGFGLFFMALLFTAALLVALLARGYFHGRMPGRPVLFQGEFLLLLLLATLGGAVLVTSAHFAALFIGLELLSVALFAMVAFIAERGPMEAGVKYLVLVGVSSAFMLFGIALVYAQFGTLSFTAIAEVAGGEQGGVYLTAGVALILTGIGLKLSLVPFHLWTPDVYQGAPAPVTAYLATASKGAVLAVLMRLFFEARLYEQDGAVAVVGVVAGASMLAGNLLALLQENVKRLLAYSSIAHMGYLLVAFLAAGPLGVEAVAYYLVAYFVMTLGAFGIVAQLSLHSAGEVERLEEYQGLLWRSPLLGGMFAAMLLSLAGIPLTVGFIAKFYAIASGVDAALWVLVALLLAGSAIGVFYYLRVIVVMLGAPPTVPRFALTPWRDRNGWPGLVALGLLTALLLGLGVHPAPLMELIGASALALAQPTPP